MPKKRKKKTPIDKSLLVDEDNDEDNNDNNKKKSFRLSNYKLSVIKTNLNNIIKNKDFLKEINKIVININKIIIHTYQFLKLYLLYCYKNDNKLPQIDEKLIKGVINIICNYDKEQKEINRKKKKSKKNKSKKKSKRKKNKQTFVGKPLSEEGLKLKRQLGIFYKNQYKGLICDIPPNSNNLSHVIKYLINDIIKNIKNNISEHFIDYVNKFINITFETKKETDKIKRKKLSEEDQKKELKEFWEKINKIKKDLVNNKNELKSDEITLIPF